jgi:purine-nucleoside phosphorylase
MRVRVASPGVVEIRDPFVLATEAAAELRRATGVERHDVAVVLGSGWGPAIEDLGETGGELPVTELPGFPAPTAVGHTGTIRSIDAGGLRVLALSGRVHLYEGHAPATVVHGVRTAIAAGVRTVVLTNACGGITDGLSVGQPVLIRDHINHTGVSPLTGPPPPEPYHSRFTDLTDGYSPRLRALVREIEPDTPECVYMGFHGPEYETPAEVRMARTLGADLVGMSTVLEAIAARHLRAEVLGLSLVTNLAAGLATEEITGDHVVEVANAASARIGPLLRATLQRLPRP